jgi:biopolymer transport protein ExbD
LNGQEIGISQLADRIRETLGDTEPGERNVFLKVHSEAQAMRFEPVIEAISEAGGDMVHILEEQRK